MKRNLIIVAVFAACILSLVSAKPKGQLRKVVYLTTIDCADCEKKVKENVSFEKGVKDLKTELESATVTIDYDSAKTDTLKLANAIRKLGYEVKVVEDKAL